MSAAEPADHIPPSPDQASGEAAVIDISTRASTHLVKGRWHGMTDRPGAGPDPNDGASLDRLVAERIEITFNEHHLTLADDSTKMAYEVTLRIVQDMLTGAHARGITDDTQHHQLVELIESLTQVPRLAHG
jgi:hypothetical protein